MDSEKLKSLIAPFLKTDPRSIDEKTAIDRRALGHSILLFRMYASLEKEGYRFEDRNEIHTFGDLLKSAREIGPVSGDRPESPPKIEGSGEPAPRNASDDLAIGIDIEDVRNMPQADDFRTDPFYTNLFSQKEISHCVIQKYPLAGFTGKFAAKEAIIKADPRFRDYPLNRIEIMNDVDGRPYFSGFSLSVSHTESQAIAVAVAIRGNRSGENDQRAERREQGGQFGNAPEQPEAPGRVKTDNKIKYIAWVALACSIIAILMNLG